MQNQNEMQNQMNQLNIMFQQIQNIMIKMNENMKVINDIERWKGIDEYDKYSISTYGRVRNDKTNRILKHKTDKGGYQTICLRVNGKKKDMKIHRLVAIAFIDNPLDKRCVDHINNDRKNNHINNLRWATISENNMNMSKQKNNTSGVTGVMWNKSAKKWRAQITIDKIKNHLGYFKTIEEAKEARIKAVNKMFGEYAHSSQKI
jgi:hypothetical protein